MQKTDITNILWKKIRRDKYRLIGKYLSYPILVICFTSNVIAKSGDLTKITRKIECINSQFLSYSVLQETDSGTYLLSQVIKFFRNSQKRSIIIDLHQHYSANRNLSGRNAIDDEALDWFCLKAATGKRYLWVMFTCANEDSTSCRYNTESSELYDDTGRALHLNSMTDAQAEALYKRLKIPPAPPNGGFISPAHHILF